ncbi:MAG: hypothetical protein GF401_09955 [Chitinivibrionales bacterium]|nr:hypothetical protein [Chitinivibrionales bacterium]
MLPKNVCNDKLSRMAAGSRGPVSSENLLLPDSVEIETDSRCNRSCPYCPSNKKEFDRGSGTLPEEVFDKILADLAAYNYSGIIRPHLFNEPLMDLRLVDFMKRIKKVLPKVDIEILSNGDLLDIETYTALVDADIKVIRVTQHGKRPTKIFNDLLEYLFKNIDVENRMRYRIFSRETPLANRGGLVEPDVLNVNPQAQCDWPMDNMAINFKGHVLLCCNDFMGHHVFGNAATENIIDIWNSEKFKSIRTRLRNGDLFMEICRKCQGIE